MKTSRTKNEVFLKNIQVCLLRVQRNVTKRRYQQEGLTLLIFADGEKIMKDTQSERVF